MNYERVTKDLVGKVAAKCKDIEYIGETLTVSATFTVPKRWEYTVTFTDGTGRTLKTQKVFTGYNATPPANPSRTGYTFTGWDSIYTNITSNKTINAKWKINSYEVKYDANDGRGIIKKLAYNYGTAITKVGADVVRKGYKLIGWSTKKETQDPEYKNGENKTYKVVGNVTFYAIWKREEVLYLKQGEYKPCKPYVKINGVWKSATPYMKIKGAWKRGIE